MSERIRLSASFRRALLDHRSAGARRIKGEPVMCKIDGVTWTDIGSDVNWREYGGSWARAMPTEAEPRRFAVLRLDMDEDTGRAYCVAALVNAANVTMADLKTCGMDPTDPEVTDLDRVRAYILTWGASGSEGGETFAGSATQARLDAARWCA